ncbi:hypothetical protein WA158_005274 [Blastocystis sp. Blastoise]
MKQFIFLVLLFIQIIAINGESFDVKTLTLPSESQYCQSDIRFTLEFDFKVSKNTATSERNIFVSDGAISTIEEDNKVSIMITRPFIPVSGRFSLLVKENTFFHGVDGNKEITASFDYLCNPSMDITAVLEGIPIVGRAKLTLSGGIPIMGPFSDVSKIITINNANMIPISMTVSENKYIFDIQSIGDYETFTVTAKQGIFNSYWNNYQNSETTVTVTLEDTTTGESATIPFWNTPFIYASQNTATIDIDSTNADCVVDLSSFYGINTKITAFEHKGNGKTTISLVVDNVLYPAILKFVGYTNYKCTAYQPSIDHLSILVSNVPTYKFSSSSCGAGCAYAILTFSQPVKIINTNNAIQFNTPSNGEILYDKQDFYAESEYSTKVYYKIIGYQTGSYTVELKEQAIISYAGDYIIPASTLTVQLVKEEVLLLINANYTSYTYPDLKGGYTFYRSPEQDATITIEAYNNYNISSCHIADNIETTLEYVNSIYDYEKNVWNIFVIIPSIDSYFFYVNVDKIVCDDFTNSFDTFNHTQYGIYLSYDPAFVPGDILISRVNSHNPATPSLKLQEFDVIFTRTVYAWNVFYVTDRSWLGENNGFLEAEKEGVLRYDSFNTIAGYGSILNWKQTDLTEDGKDQPERTVYFKLVHGEFFLEQSDNLFIYVTDNQDIDSTYDSINRTFLFGIYWGASTWVYEGNTSAIRSTTSLLPTSLQINGMHVALGSNQVPYNRLYAAIDTTTFTRSVLTSYTLQKMITSYTYWKTSSITRFGPSDANFIDNPLNYQVTSIYTDNKVIFTIQYEYPYSSGFGKNNKYISVINTETQTTFDNILIKKVDNSFTITVTLPDNFKGNVRLVALPSAFFYTSTYTSVDGASSSYVYNSYLIVADKYVSITPENLFSYSIDCAYDNSNICILNVQSTISCEWQEPHLLNTNDGSIYPLERDTNYIKYAIYLETSDSSIVLDENFCANNEGYELEALSIPVTATTIPIQTLLLSNGIVSTLFNNDGSNTIQIKYTVSKGLVYKSAKVELYDTNTFAQIPITSYSTVGSESITIRLQAVNSLPNGKYTMVLYPGTYQNLFLYNTVGGYASFYVNNEDFNLESYISQSTYSSYQVSHFTLHLEQNPFSYGNTLPSECFECTNGCSILGYSINSDTPYFVDIYTLLGSGAYSMTIKSQCFMNAYGKNNQMMTITGTTDYIAPQGLISVMKTSFNTLPYIVTVTYDESHTFKRNSNIIESAQALTSTITATGCTVQYYKALNQFTHELQLVDCIQSNTIELSVNTNTQVQVVDTNNNAAFIYNSFATVLPIVLTYDITQPTIALDSTEDFIYSKTYTFTAQVSKLVNFDASLVECKIDNEIYPFNVVSTIPSEDKLSYTITITFTKDLIHNSVMDIMFPDNSIYDEAGNGNIHSNTLSRGIYTEGPSINLSFPIRYTAELTTMLTVTISDKDKCTNYQQFTYNQINYPTSQASIDLCQQVENTNTEDKSVTFICPITFIIPMNPNYDLYQDMAFTVKSHFCTGDKKSNNAFTTYITFDQWRPTSTFTVEPVTPSHSFVITTSFTNCVAGSNEPSSYFVATRQDTSKPSILSNTCTVIVEQQENILNYIATCEFDSGVVNYSIKAGAAKDYAGNESIERSSQVTVYGDRPVSSLKFSNTEYTNKDSITVGGSNVNIKVIVSFDTTIYGFSNSCFDISTTSGNTNWISITADNSATSTNFNTGVFTFSNLNAITDTVRIGLKDECVVDAYGNKNYGTTNKLTIVFSFVQSIPMFTTCTNTDYTLDSQCEVLTTTTLSGTFTRPLLALTNKNFVAKDNECTFIPTLSENKLSFTVSIECTQRGITEITMINLIDYLGNINNSPSTKAYVYFAAYGPIITHSIENSIETEDTIYVNTRSFIFTITANECTSMTLSQATISVSNANIVLRSIGLCSYQVSGTSIIDGLISVIINEGVAENKQGGFNTRYTFEFTIKTSRPLPSDTSALPTTLYAPSTTILLRIPFNTPITLDDLLYIDSYGGCSQAEGSVENNNIFVISLITYANDYDCSITIPEGYILSAWNLPASLMSLSFAVDYKDPEFTCNIENKENMKINQSFNLICNPSESNVKWSVRNVVVSGCDAVLDMNKIIDNESLLLHYTINTQETECSIHYEIAPGFLIDVVGRLSSLQRFDIDYKVQSLTYSIIINDAYVDTNTYNNILIHYPNYLTLTNDNIYITPSGTTVLSVVPESDGVARLTIQFNSENQYTISIINFNDEYGNIVTSETTTPYTITYDTVTPVATKPLQSISISNYSDESSPKSQIVSVIFNKNINLVGNFEDSYTLSTGLSEYITVTFISMVEKTLSFNVVALSKEGQFTGHLYLTSSSYIDNGSHILSSTVDITINIYNQKPTMTFNIHGGNTFISLPISITTVFDRPVSRVDTTYSLVNKYQVKLSDNTQLICTTTSPVVYNSLSYTIECGQGIFIGTNTAITVMLPSNSVVDNYKNSNTDSSITFNRSESQYLSVISQSPAASVITVNTNSIDITMDRKLWKLDISNVVCTGSVVCDSNYSIQDTILTFKTISTSQGSYTITFKPNSIYGSDSSTLEHDFIIQHTFDNVSPIASCQFNKDYYKNEDVSVTISFTEALKSLNENTFIFNIFSGEATTTPDSVSIISSNDKQIEFNIKPMSMSSNSEFTATLSIAMNPYNCKDTADNTCITKTCSILIDNIPPVVSMVPDRVYISKYATSPIVHYLVSFDEPIEGTLTSSSLELVSEFGSCVVISEPTIITDNDKTSFDYILNFNACEVTGIHELQYKLKAQMIHDLSKNNNKETLGDIITYNGDALTAVIDDSSSFILPNEMNYVVIFNNNVESVTLDMIDVTPSSSINITTNNNQIYFIHATLDCVGSCVNTITLKNTIEDIYGSTLETTTKEFTTNLPPVITLTTNPEGKINTQRFDVIVNSNENLKTIDCSLLLQEGLLLVDNVESICSNTNTCVCSFISSEQEKVYTIVVREDTLENLFDIKNYDESKVIVDMSIIKPIVTIESDWKYGDSTFNVPITVSISKGSDISIDYIKYDNCRIVSNSLEYIDNHQMIFKIDLLETSLQYARIVFAANQIVDEYNNWNDESDFVIRNDNTTPKLLKIYYYPEQNNKVSFSFSKSIFSCGGKIQFIPTTEGLTTYEIDTNNENVHFTASRVDIYPILAGATEYKINYNENAFCDISHNNADLIDLTTCTDCILTTPYDIPTPPTHVTFENNQGISIQVSYSGIEQYKYDPMLKMTYLHVYIYPPTTTNHFIYETSESYGIITLSDLIPNTEYSLVFYVECKKGMSLPSNTFVFNTVMGIPMTPSGFKICNKINHKEAEDTDYDIELCWNTINSIETVNYVIYNNDNIICNTESSTCIINNYKSLTKKTFILYATVMNDNQSLPSTLEGPMDVIPSAPLPIESLTINRMNYKETIISWNKPATRYSSIVSYYVNYARIINIEENIMIWSNVTLPNDETMLTIQDMDNKPRYILIQANSLINGEIVSSTPTVQSFYVGAARLTVNPIAGDTFINLHITSDMAVTGTCKLSKDSILVDSLSFDTIKYSEYIFTNLIASSTYSILCNGFDSSSYPSYPIDSMTINTEQFVEPRLISLTTVSEAYFIKVIADVTVPSQVACIATYPDTINDYSKTYVRENGFIQYIYPNDSENIIIINNLLPNTEYGIKCVLTPLSTNYLRYNSILSSRRLVDNTVNIIETISTKSIYYPNLIKSFNSVDLSKELVPELIFTFEMPVIAYKGTVNIYKYNNELIQSIDVTSQYIHINKNIVTIIPKLPLQSNTKYYLTTSNTGVFIDAVMFTPLEQLTKSSNIYFMTTKDTSSITIPIVLNISPKEGLTESLSAGLYITYKDNIILNNGKLSVIVNGATFIDTLITSTSFITINENVLILKPEIVYPANANVRIIFGANTICSKGNYCMPETEYIFTTGSSTELPALISVYPNINEHVPAFTDIILTFNKLMSITKDAIFTFTDTKNNKITYSAEVDITLGNIILNKNIITIKSTKLIPGNKYTLSLKANAIQDNEGNNVFPAISNLTFDYDEYECGGEYISKYIDNNCECFTTETKCECWCGKDISSNVVLRQLFN